MSQKAQSVDVKLKINGETRHATAVVLHMTVGQLPYAVLTHHGGKNAHTAATAVSSADIAKEMEQRQAQMFKERTSPDVELQISASDGGSVSFSGLMAAPRYAFSASSVNLTDTVLPPYARMDALDFSVYQPRKQNYDARSDRPRLAKSKNVTTLTKDCAKYLFTRWKKDFDAVKKSLPELERMMREKQHKVNESCIPFFADLMAGSASTFGWDDLAKQLKGPGSEVYDQNIVARIFGLLQSSSGSFFTTIGQLAEEYQCVYVPEWDRVGKLVSKADLMENVEDNYSGPIVSLNLTAGSSGMVPVRFVAVAPNIEPINFDSRAINGSFIAYPESAVTQGGAGLRSPGPPWLPGALMSRAVTTEGNSPQKLKMNIAALKRKQTADRSYLRNFHKQIAEVMKQWAKVTYLWQALAPAQASITIPLNLKLKAGKRISVSSKEGKLFTGYLYSIEHTISSDNSSGQASTKLSFSHVEIGNFKLPK